MHPQENFSQHSDASDLCKQTEKVLAVTSLLLCLCIMSENGSIASPFVGRALLILLREEQQ
jgi:hypothetical protein